MKQKSKMLNINLTILIITINVNKLNDSIKKWKSLDWIKKIT